MINVGGSVAFWVTESSLRPSLNLALTGGIPLRFASRSLAYQDVLILGFDGPAKGQGMEPITSSDIDVTGIIVVVDISAPEPIQYVSISRGDAREVYDWSYRDPQELITFDEPSPTPTPQ